MFYLEDYLTVKKGEEIFGSIAVRPNEKNVVRIKNADVIKILIAYNFFFYSYITVGIKFLNGDKKCWDFK